MKDNTPSATPRRRGPLGWFDAMGRVFAREFRLVFSDVGIMLFFIVLPLAYPVTYTLIYNPEIVTEMPIAVVDNCRTPLSRELVRTVDASPSVSVYTYCSDMAEAKDLSVRMRCLPLWKYRATTRKDSNRRSGHCAHVLRDESAAALPCLCIGYGRRSASNSPRISHRPVSKPWVWNR